MPTASSTKVCAPQGGGGAGAHGGYGLLTCCCGLCRVWSDGAGEFRDLVRSMDPEKTDADLDTLVNLVDPYDNQHITFSECVSVLSAELVRMMSGGGGAQAASSA